MADLVSILSSLSVSFTCLWQANKRPKHDSQTRLIQPPRPHSICSISGLCEGQPSLERMGFDLCRESGDEYHNGKSTMVRPLCAVTQVRSDQWIGCSEISPALDPSCRQDGKAGFPGGKPLLGRAEATDDLMTLKSGKNTLQG